MTELKNELYKLSDEREIKLWNEAVFVFDSSALLDFYFLPLQSRKKTFDELFSKKMKDRLWIPSHVSFEYNKNREKIIKKPIYENYEPLKKDNLKSIQTSIKQIENKLKDLKQRTLKDDKHPHLSQSEIDTFTNKVSEFKSEASVFETSVIDLIDKAKDEINNLPDNDDVKKALEEHFETGRYYSFDEIIDITKEGKYRYEIKIPPGYQDQKDKLGTQIFGDLIIWKQILEHAKSIKKPIIFICNDLKEDWCYADTSTTEKRIESPREELIKEIYDYAGVEFWMYNQPQFLYLSNKYFEAEIAVENINILSQIINTNTQLKKKKKDRDSLILECERCRKKHIYLDTDIEFEFDLVGFENRKMGIEKEYQSTMYFDCDCGNEMCITFSMWEYPKGALNADDIDVDDARLISCFDFSEDAFNNLIYDKCEKCGDHFDDTENIGICSECEKKYNEN